MPSLLDQLYQTKLQLIAVITVVFGVALLVVSRWVATLPAPDWLRLVPLNELGSILVGAGLLGILFEYLERKHGEERVNRRIRDAILHSLAFDPETLKKVASTETLDQVITNALGLRLKDQALANDVYADLRTQVLRAPERHFDMRVAVTLAPTEKGPASGAGSMFVATVRREYRVRPARPVLRFACVSDLREYRELLLDPSTTEVWYFEPVAGLDAASPQAFELVQFTVDGKDRPVRRAARKHAQLFTATLGKAASEHAAVRISFTYRVLVQRNSHLLNLDFGSPCKDVQVDFSYGDCGIRHVSALDFITSAQPTRVLRSPKTVPTPTVSIRFDGWVFPKSGVAFVWVLEEELAITRSKLTSVDR